MGIAGSANIATAQTAYEAIFNEMFSGGFQGSYGLYTRTVDITAESLSIPVATSFPMVKQMLGTMEWDSIRALMQTVTPTSHGAGIRLKRATVLGDASGVVESTIRAFLASQGGDASASIEKLVADMLIANTKLGHDGVALLSDSHPYSNSTGDNLATGVALSYAAYRTWKSNMRKFQSERGIVLGINPTHLMVGPALEATALEIVGAVRPVSVDSSGAFGTTASVVGAATIENVAKGEVDVIVNPYLGDSAWLLMDLSKPGLRPVLQARLDPLKPLILDKPTDYCAVEADEYGYAIKGILTFEPGLWQLVAGRPS
jgi:phage major head subunit gpT-like protein